MRVFCMLSGLMFLFSCQVWREKTGLGQKTAEYAWLSLSKQEQETNTAESLTLDKEMEDMRIELSAKDVFYWHPDSGIVSRYGPLTVKIQSRLIKEQLVEKLAFVSQIKLKDTVLTHSKHDRKETIVKELRKEKKLRWDIGILMGVIGIVVALLGMRFCFHYLKW